MKHKKEELYLAYFETTEKLEELRKQVTPKPTTKQIIRNISLSLTDAKLSETLRQVVFDVCSILAYLYVAGTITYDYLTKTTNKVKLLCQDTLPEVRGWIQPLSFVARNKTVQN